MKKDTPLHPQEHPNGYYLQVQKQPQPGILPPVESLSGFVIVYLKKDFDLQKVGNVLSALPSVWNPPYTAENDINPLTMNYPPPSDRKPIPESVFTHANRIADEFSPTTLYANIGIGTQLYEKFFPDRTLPKRISTFKERVSKDGQHKFPATGGDLFLHIKSSHYDLILNIILFFKEQLADQVAPDGFKEWHSFSSIDGRNQFGFFDATSNAANTANPTLDVGPVCDSYPYSADVYQEKNVPEEIRDLCCQGSLKKKKEAAEKGLVVDLGKIATTFIGEEDEEHLNGCFCIVQEYIHDLKAFNKLSIKKQDTVFGRQKESGAFIEAGNPLGGGINKDYPRAHIVRTHIRMTAPFGESDLDPCVQNTPGASLAPLQIYRQAASFGTATGERGLFFLAYCRYCDTFDKILDRMIGESVTWPGSKHDADHLLDYTKAKTGQYFYMPNLEELASLATFPFPAK